jgi:hypothetical protein
VHLGLHGRDRLARGGEGFIERNAGLLEGGLALLQIGFLLGQGAALQLELAPGGLGPLDLNLVGFTPGDVPELLGSLNDGQGELLCLAVGQAAAASTLQALSERRTNARASGSQCWASRCRSSGAPARSSGAGLRAAAYRRLARPAPPGSRGRRESVGCCCSNFLDPLPFFSCYFTCDNKWRRNKPLSAGS